MKRIRPTKGTTTRRSVIRELERPRIASDEYRCRGYTTLHCWTTMRSFCLRDGVQGVGPGFTTGRRLRLDTANEGLAIEVTRMQQR